MGSLDHAAHAAADSFPSNRRALVYLKQSVNSKLDGPHLVVGVRPNLAYEGPMSDPFIAIALSMILGSETPRPKDADRIAAAIETVVSKETTPWEGHSAHDLEAVLLVTAYEESHFSMDAVGDSGSALCALQIHTSRDSVRTPEQCVTVGIQFLKESARMAHALQKPNHLLAQYCGGTLVPKAQRIGVRRMARSMKLARDAEAFLAQHEHDEPPPELVVDQVPPETVEEQDL